MMFNTTLPGKGADVPVFDSPLPDFARFGRFHAFFKWLTQKKQGSAQGLASVLA